VSDDLITVHTTKMVAGGQALGQLPDGKAIFVWNALPNETVGVRLIRQKSSFAEGVAEKIITASLERITPREENYLATSPWQMMTFAAENTYKKQIVQDIFTQAKVAIPPFELVATKATETEAEGVFGYRNKMEYSFWGDDNGLHLALHHRGSHGKEIVTGSALAMPEIDSAAAQLVNQLNDLKVRASDLKMVIIRASQDQHVTASLFVKHDNFPELDLPHELKGLRVYFSNPKSPAAVRTLMLQELGSLLLHDKLLGKEFVYDVDSFFQVNLPIYEQALARIKTWLHEPSIVDMYAGAGTIGLSVATKKVTLIELDATTAKMAIENAEGSSLEGAVIEASSEKALEYITATEPVVLDPPRVGLHSTVTTVLADVLPPKIVYLSCNPVTQARDLALLQDHYEIAHFEAFNFFPRTPHIETLVILNRC
jgi:23S rRNA (uracil1939-C5)-methyltransferase